MARERRGEKRRGKEREPQKRGEKKKVFSPPCGSRPGGEKKKKGKWGEKRGRWPLSPLSLQRHKKNEEGRERKKKGETSHSRKGRREEERQEGPTGLEEFDFFNPPFQSIIVVP